MRAIFLFVSLFVLSCAKEQEVYAPVGSVKVKTELEESRERAKKINEIERRLIEEWMKNQKEKFYPTSLNYWINVEDFDQREVQPNNIFVSYSYFIQDFEGTKVYDVPKGFRDIPLGKVSDIKAVENALKKMKPGEEVKLLVPSSLAFGTGGDGEKIGSDIPLIINLKIIEAYEK